jgi:hypothetical protein
MGRSFVGLFAVLALSACASWPHKPRICFASEPQIAPFGNAQAGAVEYVQRREAARCGAAGVECNLQLQVRPTGEIAVITSTALLGGQPLTCTRLEGGFTTYVFSANGEYSRVELGL